VLLLAFDTATPAVTVALWGDGRVLATETVVDARRQGELLAVLIDKVLAGAGADRRDLTAIAAGTGPGPYTGLRTGLVTARVLGSVLGIPVHGACTLDVIAAEAAEAAGAAAAGAAAAGAARAAEAAGREFLVATDARRREVYWARYSAAAARLDGPAVAAPANLPPSLPPGLPVAGEGALLYPDALGDPLPPRYPSAATLASFAAERLAAGDQLPPPEPLYLRRPDARVPGAPKSVLPAPPAHAARPGVVRS
jgi:tRNA threonylcarbamoyl adenosine modification protein YeaZ